MKCRSFLILVMLVSISSAVRAQTITQVVHTVYLQGTTTQAQAPATLNFSAFACGQKPKIVRPSTTIINPTRIVIDDPNDTTSDCIFTAGGTADGGLFALPFGATIYESTVRFVNSVSTGPESVRLNPFTHPGSAPPAPTGPRIVRLLLSGKTVFGFRTRRASGRFLYLVGDRRQR